MKLLLDEIVEHPDAGHVLRTLEHFLREVSLETVLTEDELIVYGLGPSFRTMNPKDKTTVRAISQPSATTLHAEANFLASALAGNAAQDEIVRAKIERAFESLKTQLNYGTVSGQKATRTPAITEQAVPSPVAEPVPEIAAASPPALVKAEEISATPIERAPDTPQTSSLDAMTEPLPKPEPQSEPQIDAKLAAKPAPRVEPKAAPTMVEPVLAAPRRSAPTPSAVMMDEAPVRKRQSGILLMLPLLIFLLAAGFYLLQHRASPSLFAAKAEEHTAITPLENKAVSPASVAAPIQSAPATMPTDVKAWVQAWAAAMSTRDAQAQLAFYSTPLDRYFLTPNVSREQLLKSKQAEIDDRKGGWTLKAEDLVIQRQSPKTAVVYLNKHIIVKLPSSTIREERIKAQLKLKMVDGEWKITSERTIA